MAHLVSQWHPRTLPLAGNPTRHPHAFYIFVSTTLFSSRFVLVRHSLQYDLAFPNNLTKRISSISYTDPPFQLPNSSFLPNLLYPLIWGERKDNLGTSFIIIWFVVILFWPFVLVLRQYWGFMDTCLILFVHTLLTKNNYLIENVLHGPSSITGNLISLIAKKMTDLPNPLREPHNRVLFRR